MGYFLTRYFSLIQSRPSRNPPLLGCAVVVGATGGRLRSPAEDLAALARRPLRGNSSRSWPRRPAESHTAPRPHRACTHTAARAHTHASHAHGHACFRARMLLPISLMQPLTGVCLNFGLEALDLGYFLIPTVVISFLPILQSSIGNLQSTTQHEGL